MKHDKNSFSVAAYIIYHYEIGVKYKNDNPYRDSVFCLALTYDGILLVIYAKTYAKRCRKLKILLTKDIL